MFSSSTGFPEASGFSLVSFYSLLTPPYSFFPLDSKLIYASVEMV